MSKVSRRSLLGWLAAAPFIGASVSKVISDAAAEEITDEMLLAGQRATDPVPFVTNHGFDLCCVIRDENGLIVATESITKPSV